MRHDVEDGVERERAVLCGFSGGGDRLGCGEAQTNPETTASHYICESQMLMTSH
jgi:hypothetical protein